VRMDVLMVPPKKFMLASAIMNGRRKKLAACMAEGVVFSRGSCSAESSCWDIIDGCDVDESDTGSMRGEIAMLESDGKHNTMCRNDDVLPIIVHVRHDFYLIHV